MGEGLRKYRGYLGGLAGLALLAAMFWINVRLRTLGLRPTGTAEASLLQVGQAWLWTALLMVAFLALVGIALNGRPAGVIIDNRNRVSLSKFQAVLWTVLVLSALITTAAARVAVGAALPAASGGVLAFTLPPELLAAMGIALTSLVASPVLLSNKTNQPEAEPETLALAAAKTKRAPDMAVSSGSVVGWRSADCAQWLDMFRGDEASNAGAPDLSKVQQFLITLVLAAIYAGSLWGGFTDAKAPFLGAAAGWLPPLEPNFVWLMGISHAGYLAYKAAPHGRTDPEPPVQQSLRLKAAAAPATTTTVSKGGAVG